MQETPKQTEPIENHKKDQLSNIERLAQEVADTHAFLESVFSFRALVARGIITGLAIVIGSTVFASIIFALIQFIFGDIPFIPGDATLE